MADRTHLQLAHRLLLGAEGGGILAPERADKISRAHAYATLAVAETLGRIADVLEHQHPVPQVPTPE